MKSRFCHKVVAIFLLTLLIGTSVGNATIPVFDYVNWFLQYLKYAYEQGEIAYAKYQRAQMILYQVQQLEQQIKALKSWGQDGDWSSLHGAMGQIDQLMNALDDLGYLLVGIHQRWEETFPGYAPPIDWISEHQSRLRRTRATYGALLSALNRLSANQTHSQAVLETLAARSRASDSPQKELEVLNMFANAQGLELTKLTMASSLTANALAVHYSYELQKEATAETVRTTWLHSQPRPAPGHDDSPGFTGIPRNWSLDLLPRL
jgi:P-type conjugative transfer protein TrbJ